MEATSKSLRSLAFASAILCSTSVAHGTLLYQWNFDSADGSNTGTGTGGALAANVGTGATTGSFSAPGVSGGAGDYSHGASNASDNWFGTDVGNAAAQSTLDLSTVNQFTVTMWVKRSGGNNADLLSLGSSTTPVSSSNPSITIGLNGTWDNGMRVGVNGYNGWVGDLWNAGTDNDWVFVAIAYDGTDNYDVWNNATMNGLYAQNRNVAIITGDTVTSASAVTGLNLHTGDWWTPVGSVALGTSATAFLATDGSNANGFSGNLDDIRIYDSLLTVSEIETVRLSAIPEPSAAVAFGAMGVVALLRRRRIRPDF